MNPQPNEESLRQKRAVFSLGAEFAIEKQNSQMHSKRVTVKKMRLVILFRLIEIVYIPQKRLREKPMK